MSGFQAIGQPGTIVDAEECVQHRPPEVGVDQEHLSLVGFAERERQVGRGQRLAFAGYRAGHHHHPHILIRLGMVEDGRQPPILFPARWRQPFIDDDFFRKPGINPTEQRRGRIGRMVLHIQRWRWSSRARDRDGAAAISSGVKSVGSAPPSSGASSGNPSCPNPPHRSRAWCPPRRGSSPLLPGRAALPRRKASSIRLMQSHLLPRAWKNENNVPLRSTARATSVSAFTGSRTPT